MSSTNSAFGGMLRQFVDLGILRLETEPFNDRMERRFKQFWGVGRVHGAAIQPSVRKSTDRVHCHSCQFKSVYK
jgi:hypothetical protein